MLPEVDGLTAGEPLRCGGVGAAGEHQGRKQPGAIQLGAEHRHPQVVAAQADRDIDRPHVVVHPVVVPDQGGLVPRLVGDGWLVVRHALVSLVTAGGRMPPRSRALMPSMLRSWWLSP